jgi:hypothetical protein
MNAYRQAFFLRGERYDLDMDDLGQPGRFPPGPEISTSGYYGTSVRLAGRLVRGVPVAWPPPLRIALQVPLVVVAAAFVVLAWILATLMLLVSSLGGGRSTSARH